MTAIALGDGHLLTREEDASRYTLTRDGVLDYRDDGRMIAFTRAFTIPTYRGTGQAARVVAATVADIVADIEARGDRQVDAVCWYVADWSRPTRSTRGSCAGVEPGGGPLRRRDAGISSSLARLTGDVGTRP